MTNRKAEFDSIFGGFNQHDPSDTDLLANDLRRQFLQHFGRIAQDHCAAQGSHPPFFVDYVPNPEINLYAHYLNRCGFIAVYTGTVPIIYDFFYRMLSHPAILTDTGDASIEQRQRISPGLWFDYCDVLKHRIPPNATLSSVLPLDEGRKRYADWLAYLALEFFAHHEIAHITLGHSEYLIKHGVRFISEFASARQSQSSPKKKLDWQACEIAADGAAAVATYIRSLKLPTESWKQQRATLDKSGKIVIPDCLLIFDWVFAIYVAFWMLSGEINPKELDYASHPPPARRAKRAIECVHSFLKLKVGEGERKRMEDELHRAVDAAGAALQIITHGNVWQKISEYEAMEKDGTMADHFRRITAKWKNIESKVEKYKHGVM